MGRRGSRAAGALTLALLFLLGAVARADGEGALQAARDHLAAGRVPEAIAVLEQALEGVEEGPEAAPLAAELGRALVLAGEPYAALRHLEVAAEHRGEAGDHLAVASALLAIGRANALRGAARWMDVGPYLEDAIDAAGRAEGDAAVRARRGRLVGEAWFWLGEAEKAVAALEAAGLAGVEEVEARRLEDLRARALYDLERPADAAEAFRAAGNARGEAAAWAAARRGREAMAVYGRLLRDTPGDERLLAEALDAARYAGAEAELAGVLAALEAEGPARAAVLVARGLLAEATGELEAAERLLDAAAEGPPETAEGLRARVELGRVRLRLASGGDEDALDRAVDPLLEALEGSPTDERTRALLWDLAGRDYAAAWRSPRAIRRSLLVQRAVVAADPSDPLAWANLGNTLRVAGEHAEAVGAYDRAVSLDATDPSILSDRGLALAAEGRGAEALEAFEAAIAIDADFDAARQNAARALWRAGRDEEAEAHLAAAARTTRRAGAGWMRYRFLQDRIYRCRRRPEVR